MKSWFRWRDRGPGNSSVFKMVLREALLPATVPRQKTIWQVYHHKFSDAVTEEYNRRGGSAPADRIATRNEIAQQQYEALPEADKEMLKEMATGEYEAEMELYKAAASDEGEIDCETQRG